MSSALPSRPATALENNSSITIIASTYNSKYTDALLESACSELAEILPGATIETLRVPGAFEIPVACEVVLSREQSPQVIIALGLIIQGQTKHSDLVAESVTASIQEMAIRHQTPIVHEVLLVSNDDQAHARCVSEELNRGKEAARAAYAMIELFNTIKAPTTNSSFQKNAKS